MLSNLGFALIIFQQLKIHLSVLESANGLYIVSNNIKSSLFLNSEPGKTLAHCLYMWW